MSTSNDHARAWQDSWDRQQESFMPDREQRIARVLDAVEAAVESAEPRLLDLAGGTGTISLRALARLPHARVTLLDLDPVLLALATASLGERAAIVSADLNEREWRATLPHQEYDAVLSSTALHWLSEGRLAEVYAEIREILRPGGLFVNVDYMPDPALPRLSEKMENRAEAVRAAWYATGAALSWREWWSRVGEDPDLAPLAEKRKEIYPDGHSPEWAPPVTWHLKALRDAGFQEAGTVWRGGSDAAVAAVK
ncbi:class I SAM-dependent methyltransferase [Micromonospora sp. KLBMP9576]|uniref:class I SAM-dependent methyltransferase n=1 Tax=Micromonospora sp. KLBMP9576 TaxID=3424769 RepID=UPI003D8E5DEE